MKINSNLIRHNYDKVLLNQFQDDLKNINNKTNQYQQNEQNNSRDQQLRLLAGEFSSILMKQMFKTMRKTIPEGKLIDGGFSEDVFTDMLDGEISELGADQKGFNTLGRLLYEQLKRGDL